MHRDGLRRGALAHARVCVVLGIGLSALAPMAAGQPAAGQAAYEESCAECHGTRLQGGAHGPALSGVSFSSVWGERSADDLFEFVRAEMPPGQVGALGDDVYRSIVTLILEADGSNETAATESAPAAAMLRCRPVKPSEIAAADLRKFLRVSFSVIFPLLSGSDCRDRL